MKLNSKKILFLPAYFYPEHVASSYISQNILEALIKECFSIELYAPTPTRGVSKETRKEYKRKKHEEFYDGKLQVHRFAMMREGKNPLQRAFRYFCCHVRHFIKGLRAKNIDLIFVASTPPTQGFMAVLLKKCKKVPLIYNLQDIFPDSMVGTGLTKKGSLLWKIGRKIENYTYQNADKIIVISEDFKQNIMKKGVPEDKIEVIYNWVDEKAVINIERDKNILFEKYGLDKNKFYVTYSGNIGLTQNMNMLVRVADKLRAKKDIHFVLIGEGVYKKNLLETIYKTKLDNMTVLPFQPYEDISHVFSLGDVDLVISKKNVGQNSVPSKTWNIMSAERPVLASFDENSELQRIIENNKVGIFVKADDEEGLINAILQLYTDRNLCTELGKNGRKFILNNLTRQKGTAKYIQVFENILNINKQDQ
jgi:glycosyltransferase involved in cell wall biosynthesis